MADDFESMSEEQLSTARGDNLKTEEPTPAPEVPVETPAEPEVPVETPAEPEPELTLNEPAKPYMIPKSRYDAVMGRLRAAEAKLSEATSAAQAAPAPAPQAPAEPSIDERLAVIDSEYTQALADGHYEQAAKLMGQARTLERQLFSQALNQVATSTRNQANAETREQLRYDTLLAEVESKIPQVVPDTDGYDEGLVAEISRLVSAFQQIGEKPADALEHAMGYVFPNGWREPQKVAEKSPPAVRTTNVQKNAAVAKAIPPKMSAGANSDKAGMVGKIDVMKLSDRELEKLTEEQLSELRGDNY